MKKLDKRPEFIRELQALRKTRPALYNKVLRIIRNLVQDDSLNFSKGEKLKYLPNCYSCRIDKKNHLIYEKSDDLIILLSCRGHYEDK